MDFILPRKTSELSFDETVKLLTELFSPKTSLFHKRWRCLNLTKNDEDDFATYVAVVNKHCDEFKLSELTADNFKCLVFAQGLLLLVEMQKLDGAFKLESLTLQKLIEDCQKIEIKKKDSEDIESGISHIKRVVKQTKTHKTNRIQDRKNYHTYPRKSDNKFEKEKFLVLATDAEACIE